mgnify:CR=1 FL=1
MQYAKAVTTTRVVHDDESLKPSQIVLNCRSFSEGHPVLNLSHTMVVVVDEADRMIDFGFHAALETIFSACRGDSTNLRPPRGPLATWMVSATWNDSAQTFVTKFQRYRRAAALLL